jgi:hypothetical protein
MDGIWNGNWIYWTSWNTQLVITLHRPLSHTNQCCPVTLFLTVEIPWRWPRVATLPQAQVILRLTSIDQFILVSGPFWGSWPDFNFLFLTITFFLLHVRRPLWREDGSVICSAVTHWLESRKTDKHTLHSHLRLSRPGRPGTCIYIPKEQGGPVTPPEHWVPFLSPLTTRRAMVEVF